MTNGPIPPQLSELQKLQFDYAWKWFSYHADQRVKMFNFMLAIFGIFAAAVVGAVANHLPAGFTAILCGIAAALGLIFPRLDRRNRDLVWLGEELLAHLERTVIFGEGVGIRGRNGESIQLGILLRQSVEERARDERPLMDILRLWAWGAAAGSKDTPDVHGALDWRTWPARWRASATDSFFGKHRVWLPFFGYVMFVVFCIAGVWISLHPQ